MEQTIQLQTTKNPYEKIVQNLSYTATFISPGTYTLTDVPPEMKKLTTLLVRNSRKMLTNKNRIAQIKALQYAAWFLTKTGHSASDTSQNPYISVRKHFDQTPALKKQKAYVLPIIKALRTLS